RAGSSPRCHRRAAHDHVAERARAHRWPLRPADDVRGRRSGQRHDHRTARLTRHRPARLTRRRMARPTRSVAHYAPRSASWPSQGARGTAVKEESLVELAQSVVVDDTVIAAGVFEPKGAVGLNILTGDK